VHELVIVDLSASNEELQNEFVQEAFKGVGCGFTTNMSKTRPW